MPNKKKTITYQGGTYLSFKEFCEIHDVTPATIYNRKRLLKERGVAEPTLEEIMNFKKKPRILAYGSHPDPLKKTKAFIEWFSRLDDTQQQNKALAQLMSFGTTQTRSQRFEVLQGLLPHIKSENARDMAKRQISRFNNN